MLDQALQGHGLCECGCGEKTTVAKKNDASRNQVKGVPARFIRGHRSKIFPPETPLICACGCGGRTAVYAGRASRFVHGHNRVRGPITDGEYTIEDRGFRTECWVWSRYKSPLGYGRVAYRGSTKLAHVLMFLQHGGMISEGCNWITCAAFPPASGPTI